MYIKIHYIFLRLRTKKEKSKKCRGILTKYDILVNLEKGFLYTLSPELINRQKNTKRLTDGGEDSPAKKLI